MATDATIMIDVFQLLGVGAVFLALEFDGVPVRGGRMTDRTVLARGSESLGVFVMQKHGGRHFQLLELALWHRCGSRRDGFGRPATVKQTTQSHPNRSRAIAASAIPRSSFRPFSMVAVLCK